MLMKAGQTQAKTLVAGRNEDRNGERDDAGDKLQRQVQFFYQGSKVNCDMEENCSDDLLCIVVKVEPEVAMIRVDQQ